MTEIIFWGASLLGFGAVVLEYFGKISDRTADWIFFPCGFAAIIAALNLG